MDVIIWGAGGLGEFVLYILSYDSDVRVHAFLDDNPDLQGTYLKGLPVLKPDEATLNKLREEGATHGIVSIGNGRVRENLSHRLEELGFKITSAIHPTAHISPAVTLGKGVIVGSAANLFYDATLGDFIFVGPSVTVSPHGLIIEDNVELCVGSMIAGKVHIHKNAFIGASASISHGEFGNLSVGEDALVGAGAVVIKDVPARAVVVGVPAKVIRYRDVE